MSYPTIKSSSATLQANSILLGVPWWLHGKSQRSSCWNSPLKGFWSNVLHRYVSVLGSNQMLLRLWAVGPWIPPRTEILQGCWATCFTASIRKVVYIPEVNNKHVKIWVLFRKFFFFLGGQTHWLLHMLENHDL